MTSATAPTRWEEKLSPPLFERRLQTLASELYHDRHPFNLLMHAGRLHPLDLRAWTANRYYYQTRIPIKDALIVAKSEDVMFRRVWTQRIIHHDGTGPSIHSQTGGLELWRRIGAACGLTRKALEDHAEVLPVVRQVCDQYVEFVRAAPLVSAVASSLTEYFAGDLMRERIEAWKRHYPWLAEGALTYFERRVERAPEDAAHALRFVLDHAQTKEEHEQCLDAFRFKCALLWRLLDAVYFARRRALRPRLAKRALLQRTGSGLASRGPLVQLPEKALRLNETAEELLARCDGRETLGSLLDKLAAEYAVAPDDAALDVATFMAELECRQVLVFLGSRDP